MRVLIWKGAGLSCGCEGDGWMDSFGSEPGLASLYVYTWCHDPYVLSCSSTPFAVAEKRAGEFEEAVSSSDLVIVPHSSPDIPWACVRHHIETGKPAILVQPSAEGLAGLSPLKDVEWRGGLLSNREDWVFRCSPGKEYQYPQQLWFDRYLVDESKPLAVQSMIADWPDCITLGAVGLFSSDFVHAYELYRHAPRELCAGGFADDSTLMFVSAIRAVLGSSTSEQFISVAKSHFELRRDFHSFGYVRNMVEELSKELSCPVGFEQADALILEAARLTVGGADGKEIGRVLVKAFESLGLAVQDIAPFPKYLVDSLHGGILFEKYGFGEYDYPTSANEWISAYLDMADRKNYRFCLEVSSITHENARKRHPLFYDRIKRYWREGKVEVVGGTYGQPYPEYLSLESNVRQFAYGQSSLEQVLGDPATVYMAQEFGLSPQHPSILAGHGYKHVCHRVTNRGRAPVEDALQIIWEGKDGSRIPALPSHHDRSEADEICFYIHLPRFIAATEKHKYEYGVYVNMLDIFWMPPFREEHIRATFHYPVLGMHSTFSGFLESAGVRATEIRTRKIYDLEDYEWPEFPKSRWYRWAGSMTHALTRIHSAEALLESTEKFWSIAYLMTGKKGEPLEKAWKALAAYENHDSFCVSQARVGDFVGSFAGKPGPTRPITLDQAGWQDLRSEIDFVSDNLESALTAIAQEVDTRRVHPGTALVLFNPCSFSRTAFISQVGQQVDIPALGYVAISSREVSAVESVQGISIQDQTTMTNGVLEVCFDADTGAMAAVYDLSGGRRVVTGLSNEFVYGAVSKMVCGNIGVKDEIGCKVAVVEGKVLGNSDDPVAFFRSEVKLQPGEPRIFFETTIHPAAIDDGDQWVNSVKARFRPAFRPINVKRIYLNVMERVRSERFVSLYLVDIFSDETGHHLLLHNRGAQHYIRHDDAIDNVLLSKAERARTFRYCLEVGVGQVSHMKSALDFQMPIYVRSVPSVPHMNGKLPRSFSLLQMVPEEVIVTSVDVDGDSVRIRVTESSGCGGVALLKTGFPIEEAFSTDYRGKRLETLPISGDGSAPEGNTVNIVLAPWSILNIELVRRVEVGTGMPVRTSTARSLEAGGGERDERPAEAAGG